MPATATQIFDFLGGHPSFTTERHEISLAEFGALRRSLRFVVVKLREGGDLEAAEPADRLRSLLSEWLTVPVPFDGSMLATLHAFGDPTSIEARWGSDIRGAFETALRAARALHNLENPIRTRLQAVIRELQAAGRPFKIYCHRTARPRFDSLFAAPGETPLPESAFLHSPPQYRDAETFDTLVKIGPLRSCGWGSAPDAIRAAPRFATLIQIVWAGCADEPGFGYDPVFPVAGDALPAAGPGVHHGSIGNRISWTPRVTRFGDAGDSADDELEEDELQTFSRLAQSGQKRRAILFLVDDGHGILYPPLSQIISFDPSAAAGEPIARRLAGESLTEGMYVIRPQVNDLDLGGVQAGHGYYSLRWKALLDEQRAVDASGLIRRLREAGLDLVHLDSAVRHWLAPPSTVIHAPQQLRHFQILVRVLGLNGMGSFGDARHRGVPWWHLAWNEIRHSRGEAIQAGVQGQEIVGEQLLVILRSLLPQIRERAAANVGFHLPIPGGQGIEGSFLFFKVQATEPGYLAHDTELKVVHELNTIQQWRA